MRLAQLAGLTGTGDVKVATVCGSPSGAHHLDVKAAEASRSVADGADEVDVVVDLGLDFVKTSTGSTPRAARGCTRSS